MRRRDLHLLGCPSVTHPPCLLALFPMAPCTIDCRIIYLDPAEGRIELSTTSQALNDDASWEQRLLCSRGEVAGREGLGLGGWVGENSVRSWAVSRSDDWSCVQRTVTGPAAWERVIRISPLGTSPTSASTCLPAEAYYVPLTLAEKTAAERSRRPAKPSFTPRQIRHPYFHNISMSDAAKRLMEEGRPVGTAIFR